MKFKQYWYLLGGRKCCVGNILQILFWSNGKKSGGRVVLSISVRALKFGKWDLILSPPWDVLVFNALYHYWGFFLFICGDSYKAWKTAVTFLLLNFFCFSLLMSFPSIRKILYLGLIIHDQHRKKDMPGTKYLKKSVIFTGHHNNYPSKIRSISSKPRFSFFGFSTVVSRRHQ